MLRAFGYLSLVALLCGEAFGQSAETQPVPPKFEAADVHVSPRGVNQFFRGAVVHGGVYELKTATMVDLIRTAYGIDADKIFGGPNWLEMDRFDVRGKVPADSTPETHKLMLQALLAERFKLGVHNETKPMPALALTVGKKAQLKPFDSAHAQSGCQPVSQTAAAAAAAGGARIMIGNANGGDPIILSGPTIQLDCHNMSMAAFAEAMRTTIGITPYLNGERVVDQTGLEGTWDFSLKYSMKGLMMGNAGETITLADALEKQLGLKLSPVTVPTTVLVVDRANEKPAANPPGVEDSFPPVPTEFDVGEIKPAEPIAPGGRGPVRMPPPLQNGKVDLRNYTLKSLIMTAWNINDDSLLAGTQKWMDTDRFDVIAKSAAVGPSTGPFDFDPIRPMLQKLLMDKFKLAVHYEDRQVNGYILSAVKPKLQKADPAGRTKCKEGPGLDGKDPRDANPLLSRLVTCQNMTMAQMADMLPNIAGGYFRTPAVDATGLEGAWDFTLSFSPAGLAQGMVFRSVDGAAPASGAPGAAAASDPSGGLTFFDALTKQLGLKLEMQKRSMPVLVIDHVEQKPTDN